MPIADFSAMAPEDELMALGVEERLAVTAGGSHKTFAALRAALSSAGIGDWGPDPTTDSGKTAAALVYTASTKIAAAPVGDKGKEILFRTIGEGKIDTAPKAEAAAAFMSKFYRGLKSDVPNASVRIGEDEVSIDIAEFEKAAGVGVVVTDKNIVDAVTASLKENEKDIIAKRYRFNTGLLQKGIMEKLGFADGKRVNKLIKENVEALLGPKTEADNAKPKKVKKPKAPKVVKVEEGTVEAADPFEGIPARFDARGLASAENTPELLALHKEKSGGKIVCRFPPEPNGYLHVGHAKAMFISFGYAKKMNGDCVLRFDDTNPVGEETEYIKSIEEMCRWMGHSPTRITYSSDYFPKLFELAVELIKRGKAFVCFQTGDEVKRDRENCADSPFRNRSVEENLELFEGMRKGKFAEGEATLRMKIDMKHDNPCMRDPVAYRIIYAPHPHVGDEWCIYPSYDYTHCLVDSLEWVTHSLCTLEFEIRRDSYYWLLEALDLYRPFVWEFARLNLEFTMMSKRKLKQLVDQKYVSGWDDPRMPTLSGMRRRGYPSSALNRFCSAIGTSRGTNVIGMHVLEHWVRADLDPRVPRVLTVLRPLKLTITNFKGEETLKIKNHPKNDALGEREVTLTKVVYIERTDFRSVDDPKYYGLAPGKTAMLRYAYPVTVDRFETSDAGDVTELFGTFDYEKSVKPKGVLHWVNNSAPVVEVRLYNKLFNAENPAGLKSAWLDDLNPESEIVLKTARIEKTGASAKKGDCFQFERSGYFVVDNVLSTDGHPVFNMTVSLKALKASR